VTRPRGITRRGPRADEQRPPRRKCDHQDPDRGWAERHVLGPSTSEAAPHIRICGARRPNTTGSQKVEWSGGRGKKGDRQRLINKEFDAEREHRDDFAPVADGGLRSLALRSSMSNVTVVIGAEAALVIEPVHRKAQGHTPRC